MTKGELIRLMEGTDDDIPVVIERPMSDNKKINIINVKYEIGSDGYGYYLLQPDIWGEIK